MDTLSNPADTEPEPSLTEEDQAALRVQVLHHLANLPFPPGGAYTRSLWLISIGPWGAWTHAVLPVDGKLDLPDRQHISGLCHLLAGFLEHHVSGASGKALIALHRPSTADVSRADMYIYDLLRAAAADRSTVPWTFHVAGPDGIWEVG